MRIKKVSQTTATQAQVVNNTNDSKLNAYSCDYVNDVIKDIYSTDEVKTNKVWIDGKPIYRKVFSGDISSQIATGLTNINVVNTYGIVKSASGATMPLPSLRPAYANYNIGFYVSSDFKIVFENGSSAGGTAYITLEYTKTTD